MKVRSSAYARGITLLFSSLLMEPVGISIIRVCYRVRLFHHEMQRTSGAHRASRATICGCLNGTDRHCECASALLGDRFNADLVVDRSAEALFASQVSLSRLH